MISSTSNAKVKNIANLLTSAKMRRESKTFVVEGARIVREIPKDRIVECYVSEKFEDLSCIPNGVSYEIVSEQVFKKMSDTKSPQGILCLVKISEITADIVLEKHKTGDFRMLVLEGIQDPGNMGTMIRTAEGAGFDCIIADSHTVDIYNPKVTRSTMGSMFRVPVVYTSELIETVNLLRKSNVKVCAAHLKGECSYREAEYTNRCAVLIGNEGNGLSDEISDTSDLLVKIPMQGKVESLNAAVAAALLMYEVAGLS